MILAHFLIIFVFMMNHAYFAGIETGVISVQRIRLRHFVRRGHSRARILERFVEDFDKLLGTTLIGTNISVVVTSVTATRLAFLLGVPGGQTVTSIVTAALVIIFCEYLPKAWFHARPLERSSRFIAILNSFEWLFRPASYIIISLASMLTPKDRDRGFTRPPPFVTREDLKILAREGEKGGVLSAKERYMIHRVMELSTVTAKDIMIPADRIQFVDNHLSVPVFFEQARESGLTRFPCRDKTLKTFTGVVNIFDVLSSGKDALTQTVDEFARPPLFIPADMQADRILPQMRRAGHPLCLVRQQKKIIGLITTEDILRIIVGSL